MKIPIPPTKPTCRISGKSQLLRQLFTATASPSPTKEPASQQKSIRKQSLLAMLFALGPTGGGKVSDVLHRVIRSGQQVSRPLLRDCLKDLRQKGRFQQCLEILEWLENGRSDYPVRDYALRLNIVCELKGIDEAEKYFESIPPDLKNQAIYGALLNCYCSKMATDKALALFRKMDEMSFVSHVLVFNNMMTLYLKVGQPEEVPALVDEMKKRNIPLNNFTYSFWIQSYRLLGDLESVERVMNEVQERDIIKHDWVIHSTVAAAYIEAGLSEKAIQALEKLEDVLDNSNNPDRNGYHYLISMYASTGKPESVIRVWNKLKSKIEVCTNLSYLILLQALKNLDDIEGVKKYFREWESSCRSYDDRLPTVVIGAYLKHDMLEEAESLLKEARKTSRKMIGYAYVHFMNYYFEKRQIGTALKHMEAAVAAKWKPYANKLDPFFQYFKEEKDVEGAEKFCRLLKEAQSLDATAYRWLLQTYAAAGKTAPDLCQRMEEDGVNITPGHQELLETVCTN